MTKENIVKSQMTPRERVLAAINHQPVDRVPTDYWGTNEATGKFMRELGCKTWEEFADKLNIDGLPGVWPKYIGPEVPKGKDMWGVEYETVHYSQNGNDGVYDEMVRHPIEHCTSIDEIEACYTFPKADWFDYSNVRADCEKIKDHAIQGPYMSPWYMYANIRGLEQSMCDMAAEPEIADYILGKIVDFYIEHHSRTLEAAGGLIDICQVTEDFGSQKDLLISLDMFDRYFRRHFGRMIKMCKDFNTKVFHHDDGSIMKIVPIMVELGIDILNPIQWHLPGMDLDALKNNFGKKICFHGAIDNQDVLPFGTVADVREEVKTCIEKLACDGTGYILAPCHNMQVISPTENLVEMYRAAGEFGIIR